MKNRMSVSAAVAALLLCARLAFAAAAAPAWIQAPAAIYDPKTPPASQEFGYGVFLYRTTVKVDGAVKLAGLLSSDKVYNVYVNGRSICARFRERDRWPHGRYQPLDAVAVGSRLLADITAELKPGENTLIVRAAPTGFEMLGRIESADGRVSEFATSAAWEAARLEPGRVVERGMQFEPEEKPVWQPAAVGTAPAAGGQAKPEPNWPEEAFGAPLVALHAARFNNTSGRIVFARHRQELLETQVGIQAGRLVHFGNFFQEPWEIAGVNALRELRNKAETAQSILVSQIKLQPGYDTAMAAARQADAALAAFETGIEAVTDLYMMRDEISNLRLLCAMLEGKSPEVATVLAETDSAAAEYRQLADAVKGAAELAQSAGALGALRGRVMALRPRLEKAAGAKLSNLNESGFNPCGWMRRSHLVMGATPEAANICIGDPENPTERISLAGVWRFTIDPHDEGLAKGFHNEQLEEEAGWDQIFVPARWENLGYTEQYPDAASTPELKCRINDEPYNGFAWYRCHVYIPKSWNRWGQSEVHFRLGEGGVDDQDWVYVNGRQVGTTGPNENRHFWMCERDYRLDRSILRFGEINTIAVRAYDYHSDGGILGMPWLELQPEIPFTSRSDAGDHKFSDTLPAALPEKAPVIASGLAPAFLARAGGQSVSVWGWERAACLPESVTYVGADGPTTKPFAADAPIYDRQRDGAWTENWLLINIPGKPSEAWVGVDRPRLLVFEKQPALIKVAAAPGGRQLSSLQLDFGKGNTGGLIAVMPLDMPFSGGQPQPTLLERCRFWSRALLAYPVNFAEIMVKAPDRRTVTDRYEYIRIADEWKTEPLQVAPAPNLFSFAVENKFPAVAGDGGITELPFTTRKWGVLRGLTGAAQLLYRLPPEDPARLRGTGVMSRGPYWQQRPENVGFEADWLRMKAWGFNGNRIQPCPEVFIAEKSYITPEGPKQGWDNRIKEDDVFEQDGLLYSKRAFERLDEIVELAVKTKMNLCINFYDSPSSDTEKPWYMPIHEISKEARARNPEKYDYMLKRFKILWGMVAKRYKDKPAWAVTYDLINEPGGSAPAEYNRLMRELTEIIRAEDKVHPIIIETPYSCSHIETYWCLEPTGDPNTMYSCHYYGNGFAWLRVLRDPLWIEEDFLPAIRFMLRHNAKLHCGEWAIISNATCMTLYPVGPVEPEEDCLQAATFLWLFDKYDWNFNYYSYNANQGLVGKHPFDSGLLQREFVDVFRSYFGVTQQAGR